MTAEERLKAIHDRERNIMLKQADDVKRLLKHCMTDCGATVTIAVAHDCGQSAIANLYDNAALVQSLYDALSEFIEDFTA